MCLQATNISIVLHLYEEEIIALIGMSFCFISSILCVEKQREHS